MGAKKIIVVDDENDVSTYLSVVLSDHGYNVRRASTGGDGLALATEDKPDLVCLDVFMPGQTGLWLYRRMCATPELSSVPVLIISGLGMEQGLEAMLAGLPRPAAYFEKPIDRGRLVETIGHLLGNGEEP